MAVENVDHACCWKSIARALKGKISRPVYDSRFVGLLGQPESLFTTAGADH